MRVKICGITKASDAREACRQGAWAVGVILCSASPRALPPEQAKEIFQAVPSSTLRVAVSDTSREGDLETILSLEPDAVQLYHPLTLPEGCPCLLYRVYRGGGIPTDADALVLDASHGRGIPCDPETARRIVATSLLPVILSGGLRPETVASRIRTVRPWAVDVSSGLESSCGCKDPEMMERFFAACREVGA